MKSYTIHIYIYNLYVYNNIGYDGRMILNIATKTLKWGQKSLQQMKLSQLDIYMKTMEVLLLWNTT